MSLKLESSSNEIELSSFSIVGQSFANPGDCVIFDLKLKLSDHLRSEESPYARSKELFEKVKSAESITASLSYQLWTGATGYFNMDLTSRK